MAVYKAGTQSKSGAGHDRVSDLIWNGIILFTGIFQPGNHGRIFSYEEADGISVPVGDRQEPRDLQRSLSLHCGRGSRLLGCLLMFIGGSPTGTAGGIKTTTAAMLVLTVISVLRGRKDTECFNRKIDETVVRSGITISLVTFFFWMSGVTVLTILEPGQDFLNLMYEVTSAMGNRRVDSRPDTVSVQGESCRADDPDVYRTDRTGDDGTCICRKGGENDTISVLSRKEEL